MDRASFQRWNMGWKVYLAILAALLSLPVSSRGYPSSKEPTGVSSPLPQHRTFLSGDIKEMVRSLGYSDEVAKDVARMVNGWKDEQKKPALSSWKRRLSQANRDCENGKISKAQLAGIEENLARELSRKIQKEISYKFSLEFFDLAVVVKHRQASCLGYAQLACIVGDFVGLSVQVIDVAELVNDEFPTEYSHVANMVTLSDGRTLMVDLAPASFTSKPFLLKEEFAQVGSYWELKDKTNPLRIHKTIRAFDRSGLLACICAIRPVIYGKSGQLSQSVSDYTRAIELDPLYAVPHYCRGITHTKLRQLSEAISDFAKAVECNPRFAAAYCSRGFAYVELGQFPAGISDYTRAIELNSKYVKAYLNRGSSYGRTGQFQQAISDYAKVIEMDPGYASAYYGRGVCLDQLGQPLQAISNHTKAIELNPKYAEAYCQRGVSYGKSGQYSQALSDFTHAIEINPQYAEAYFNRAAIHATLGKPEEARRDLLKVLELNPALKPAVKKSSDRYELGLQIDASSGARE